MSGLVKQNYHHLRYHTGESTANHSSRPDSSRAAKIEPKERLGSLPKISVFSKWSIFKIQFRNMHAYNARLPRNRE